MTSPLTTTTATTVKKDVGDFYALVDGFRMGGARSPMAMRTTTTTTVDESAREKDGDDDVDDADETTIDPMTQWERLREWRTTSTSRASVDDFHEFLVSLRDKPEPRYQALVAALLSVQCLDKVALRAYERLRESVPGGEVTLEAVRGMEHEDLERCLKTLNFHSTKARYVRECSDALHYKFRGEVPRAVGALKTLPGVGDKLAHLIASVAYSDTPQGGDFAGVVVDTHVKRVAKRLGWTTTSADPEKVRMDVQSLFRNGEDWEEVTLSLIALGQNVCKSQLPACDACPLRDACPSSTRGATIDVEDAGNL
jgi:endonuclease-3